MQKEPIICIYKITSPSNKIYIGQTTNLRKRKNSYRAGFCKKQQKLYASFKKYGFENHIFSIVEICNLENLTIRERYWQEKLNVLSIYGLNLRYVTDEDRIGKLSEESKLKISIKNSGSGNGMFGKKIKESSKQLKRDKLTGENNYLSKLVLNTETGIYYSCLTEAAKSRNILKGSLWSSIVKNKVNKTPFIYA